MKVLFIILSILGVSIVLEIVSWYLSNSAVGTVLSIIANVMYFVIILALIICVIVSYVVVRRDRVLFHSFVSQNRIDEGIISFELKTQKYNLSYSKQNSNILLLTLYFMNNDITKASNLLNKYHWKLFISQVLYFKILLAIYDKNIVYAKQMFCELKKKKASKEHLLLCEQIFEAIDNRDKTNHFYKKSVFPIVKEIYDNL